MTKKSALARVQRLHDLDDRSHACYEDMKALGAALRETADRAERGRVPLKIIEDDVTLVTKVERLRQSSSSS